MGFLDKFQKFGQTFVGDDDETMENDYDVEEGYEDEYDEDRRAKTEQKPQAVKEKAPAYGNMRFSENNMAPGMNITVVRPEAYESSGQIADSLINGSTVILNLEATNKETAKRILDFLSGVVYSVKGHIEPVTNNTYVVTPKSASVSNQSLTEDNTAKKETLYDEE